MYRRDYIQRMIEEFGRVLSRAMGLRDQNRNEDALQELRDSCRPFFGFDYEILAGISPEALPLLITETVPLEPIQMEALAQSLELEAELCTPFNSRQAIDRFNKALAIYRHLKVKDTATFSLIRFQSEQRISNRLVELIST